MNSNRLSGWVGGRNLCSIPRTLTYATPFASTWSKISTRMPKGLENLGSWNLQRTHLEFFTSYSHKSQENSIMTERSLCLQALLQSTIPWSKKRAIILMCAGSEEAGLAGDWNSSKTRKEDWGQLESFLKTPLATCRVPIVFHADVDTVEPVGEVVGLPVVRNTTGHLSCWCRAQLQYKSRNDVVTILVRRAYEFTHSHYRTNSLKKCNDCLSPPTLNGWATATWKQSFLFSAVSPCENNLDHVIVVSTRTVFDEFLMWKCASCIRTGFGFRRSKLQHIQIIRWCETFFYSQNNNSNKSKNNQQ